MHDNRCKAVAGENKGRITFMTEPASLLHASDVAAPVYNPIACPREPIVRRHPLGSCKPPHFGFHMNLEVAQCCHITQRGAISSTSLLLLSLLGQHGTFSRLPSQNSHRSVVTSLASAAARSDRPLSEGCVTICCLLQGFTRTEFRIRWGRHRET